MSDLLRFNPRQKTFTPVTSLSNGQPLGLDEFKYVLRDSKQRLWLSGEKGLDIYTEHENGLSVCPLLPKACPIKHKAINVIYEAYNGIFWIGTRSGLFRFDEARKEYKQYTVADGLPNNVIHGILEDEYGKLWLSTNKGLSCFHPETEKFRNYTNNDGLQSNQFTNNAYYRTAEGQMYFGGINGITYIPSGTNSRQSLYSSGPYHKIASVQSDGFPQRRHRNTTEQHQQYEEHHIIEQAIHVFA